MAISRGWKIGTGSGGRITPQSNQTHCEIFIKPPVELGLPNTKALKLNKIACGLIEASKVSYLQQAKELEDNGFHPLKTDPALFIYKSAGQSMCNVVSTIHGKDLFITSKQNIMTDTEQGVQEEFEINGKKQPNPSRNLNRRLR